MTRLARLLAPVLTGIAFAGSAGAAPVPSASRTVTLDIPDGMKAPPFDVPRSLAIPPGFSIGVFARVQDARFMAVAPNGDLLVSTPGAGAIILLRPRAGAAPQRFTFASGLRHPHDIVFHKLNGKTYVYIAESDRVVRAPYVNGQTGIENMETVVDHLPDASSEKSKGGYRHPLKNIALAGDKLYVSIGSSCNACASDTTTDPVRGAIYQYDANGGKRRLYARGLRNAEGLAFKPGTDQLWAVVNGSDNIAYPFHKDWNGGGSDDFGKVIQDYVDGHPPDLLTRVKDGGNYGWPFCNADPDHGLDNMGYDRDAKLNPGGDKLDCSKAGRATKGLAPHSAPLGFSFLQNAGLPEPYRNALVIALHGCWNCSKLNGNKVVLYPLRADGTPGDAVDLVTGWVTDAESKQRWGRPVDVVPNGKGGLYISDDRSGTVYLLQKSS